MHEHSEIGFVRIPERDLYFVRREGGLAYGGKTIEAFRRGDWKLVQDSPFAPQLSLTPALSQRRRSFRTGYTAPLRLSVETALPG